MFIQLTERKLCKNIGTYQTNATMSPHKFHLTFFKTGNGLFRKLAGTGKKHNFFFFDNKDHMELQS